MKQKKEPIRVVKKKYTDKHILYKLLWSNGCSSYEPLSDMNQEITKLVRIFEINQVSKDDESLRQKLLKQFDDEQYIKKQQKILDEERMQQEPKKDKKIKPIEQVLDSEEEEEFRKARKKKQNAKKQFHVKSVQCQIKHLRKLNNKNNNYNHDLQFLGNFPNCKSDHKDLWMQNKQIQNKSSSSLCDQLLEKIKWSQDKQAL